MFASFLERRPFSLFLLLHHIFNHKSEYFVNYIAIFYFTILRTAGRTAIKFLRLRLLLHSFVTFPIYLPFSFVQKSICPTNSFLVLSNKTIVPAFCAPKKCIGLCSVSLIYAAENSSRCCFRFPNSFIFPRNDPSSDS